MGYDPPGLESTPEDQALAGFGSLMPAAEKKPGIVSRILSLPIKLITLPLKVVKAILGLPGRLFRRGKA